MKRTALAEIEPEVKRLSAAMPFDTLVQIVNMWYTGLVKQVTNFPPDIMIEKWIYNDYPALRPYQYRSLTRQNEEVLAGLSARVERMTPRRVLEANHIMAYAYFKILGDHLGVDWVRRYLHTPYLKRGEELVDITRDYVDTYEGDIQMINKWAEFLGLAGWFAWTDFENVPPSYVKAV